MATFALGVPAPDNKRTAHALLDAALSFRMTFSAQEPAYLVVHWRAALELAAMPSVLPEYVGLVAKRPALVSKPSSTVVVGLGAGFSSV